MVNHNKNMKLRIIYFLILFVIYREIFAFLDLGLNLAMYGMFAIMAFLYYLFDTIDFSKRYRRKNLIYSTILNFASFMIFYFFYKSIEVVIAFIAYNILQNLVEYIFYRKNSTKLKTIIIDDREYIDIIKKALFRAKQYTYVGYVSNINTERRKYLGKIEELSKIIEENGIENIIFTKTPEVKRCANYITEQKLKGVRVVDYLSFLEEVEGKIDVDKIDSFWVLMSSGFDTFHSTFQKKLKRAFDTILAGILFICFVPFMAVTYVLVKLDIGWKYLFTDPKKIIDNPAFFKQKRLGFKGEEFEIIKFRSMKVHDPEKYSKYASEHDDRITKVGHFIRKTRLDELPQVVNVLRGDMSFVGPRPEWDALGRDYEKKIKNYHLRYAVQPGITGWAQTMFTYGASLDDAKVKLEYDLYYVKNQSLILDLIILFKTSKTVLFGKGM